LEQQEADAKNATKKTRLTVTKRKWRCVTRRFQKSQST
jgi:hypothetical protein